MPNTITPVKFRSPALNGGDKLTHAVLHDTSHPTPLQADAMCGIWPISTSGGWITVVGGVVNCPSCSTAIIRDAVKHG
jgi:hypothetical protein